jgi:hypothetical protein
VAVASREVTLSRMMGYEQHSSETARNEAKERLLCPQYGRDRRALRVGMTATRSMSVAMCPQYFFGGTDLDLDLDDRGWSWRQST